MKKFWLTKGGSIIGVDIAEKGKLNPATGESIFPVTFGTVNGDVIVPMTASRVKASVIDYNSLPDGLSLDEILS